MAYLANKNQKCENEFGNTNNIHEEEVTKFFKCGIDKSLEEEEYNDEVYFFHHDSSTNGLAVLLQVKTEAFSRWDIRCPYLCSCLAIFHQKRSLFVFVAFLWCWNLGCWIFSVYDYGVFFRFWGQEASSNRDNQAKPTIGEEHPFGMSILCHKSSVDASDDTTNTCSDIHETDKVLWAKLGILSRLYDHNSIWYNIHKCFSHWCNTEQNGNGQRLFKFASEDHKQCQELQNTHNYQVAFPSCSTNWHIVWNETIENLETPRNMNDGHINLHFTRIKAHVLFEIVLDS